MVHRIVPLVHTLLTASQVIPFTLNVGDKKHLAHPLPLAQIWLTHPYTKVGDPPPSIKTWIFGFLLIIHQNLVLCITKSLDTLLQPISKSQIIPFSENTNVKNRTFLVSMDVMSLDTNIPQNEGIKTIFKALCMKISTGNLFRHITCRKWLD